MNLPGSYLMGLDGRPPRQRVSWSELSSPENHDLAEYSIDEARSGHQCRFTACRPTASGLPRWWDIAANPIFDARGVPSQMFCICRDVTELKQAERSLQQEIASKELLMVEASHRVKNHRRASPAHWPCRPATPATKRYAPRCNKRSPESRRWRAFIAGCSTGGATNGSSCVRRWPRSRARPLQPWAWKIILPVTISCPQGLTMATDRGVALLLMTTELITYSLKHAYPTGSKGSVRITGQRFAAPVVIAGR